jgi:hypothetical protein
VASCQNLSIISENKGVKKLMLSKCQLTKNELVNSVSSMKKKSERLG